MKHDRRRDASPPKQQTPRYEPPRVVAYDESELLDMIGPAVACARWEGSSLAPGRPGSWSYEPGEYEDF
jgi:hypothetical protein